MKGLCRWLLYQLMGWKLNVTEPYPEKCIICLAPHTSNWDFLIGQFYARAEGMKTNVTLIFTANQALLAARAGATYVSPFLGRLDDISVRGTDLIREIADIFAVAGIETQIICASVRNPIHVTDCALAGGDIATVPFGVLMKMINHPLTDIGIEKFKADYIAVFGE